VMKDFYWPWKWFYSSVFP